MTDWWQNVYMKYEFTLKSTSNITLYIVPPPVSAHFTDTFSLKKKYNIYFITKKQNVFKLFIHSLHICIWNTVV